MALPAYVVNFDELVQLMLKQGIKTEIEMDNGSVNETLNYYFPKILGILEKIEKSNNIDGSQKAKGFTTNGETISFTAASDICLSGITFSKSSFDGGCTDKLSLKIRMGKECIVLFDGIYIKDALQHKYLEKYYPIPAGCTVLIDIENQNGSTYWIDLEYLELN